MEFDFSTNAALDTLDSVPEQFRGVYVQNEGKYVVNDTLKGVVEAVTGLNKALKTERTQHGELKKAKDVSSAVKEALGEHGIESLDQAKAKIGELVATVAEKGKVDPAKIRAEIEQTFAGERTKLQGEIESMQGTLSRYLVDAEANAQLNAAKGNSKLLLPVIKAATKVVKDGDEYVVRVLDADGSYRGDGKGGFMTVADLVGELKNSADYKVAFASDAPTGGGGNKNPPASRQAHQQRQTKEGGGNDNPTSLIQRGLAARRK
jgi:hypothetical protein